MALKRSMPEQEVYWLRLLEDQIRELRARVLGLEKAVRNHGIVVEREPAESIADSTAPAAPRAVPTPLPAPISSTVSPHEHETAPAQVPFPPPYVPPAAPQRFGFQNAPQSTHALESRIGSEWFNWLGILAVLIGMAWFLKLAFDNNWIGPLGRVMVGLLVGAALIAWSERFQRRGYVAFSHSLKAIGSGTLYLSLWAAYSVYAILPASAAFAAMIVVTVFNGFMAWKRNVGLLAVYAIAGGLCTPLLVSTGGNQEVTLFSYLLILDVAVLVLVALRPWPGVLFLTFFGTVYFVLTWWTRFFSQNQTGRTAFFVGSFLLIFAFAPRLIRTEGTESAESSFWDNMAIVALPILNASLGFFAFYRLFHPFEVNWAGPSLAITFAAFYLLLHRLPARGLLRASPALLSTVHLSIAVVFLIVAIPLRTHGRWLTIGWLAEGGALIWLAIHFRQQLLQAMALFCLLLGLMTLLIVNTRASLTPFLNQRFGTYAVAVAVFAFVARLAWKAWMTDNKQMSELPMQWRTLTAVSELLISGLILLAVGWEIHSYWWYLHWQGTLKDVRLYRIYSQFSYSTFFMIFGAALLAIGFWRRSSSARWQALILLTATIAKVFLIDITQLSQGLRIISFLGLGALLLAVSFVYQRDWLNLRGQGEGAR